MGNALWRLSATELATGYRAQSFSPVDALEAILARIAAVNARLNAFVTLDAEGAYRQATLQLPFGGGSEVNESPLLPPPPPAPPPVPALPPSDSRHAPAVQTPKPQVVPSGATTSAGHALDTPSHSSTASHTEMFERHTCVALTGPHVPSAAAPAESEQAWQSLAPPAQRAAQHTPSAQKVDAQSASALHSSPLAAGTPKVRVYTRKLVMGARSVWRPYASSAWPRPSSAETGDW